MRIHNVDKMPTPMVLPVCDTPLDLDHARHIGIRVHEDGSIVVPCTGMTTLNDVYHRPSTDPTERAYLIVIPDDDGTHYGFEIRSGRSNNVEVRYVPELDEDEKDELFKVINSWLYDKVMRYQKKYGVMQDYR